MFTIADLFKDGYTDYKSLYTPVCDLPPTCHEAETRCKSERNTPRTLPVEKGGKMDVKNSFGN